MTGVLDQLRRELFGRDERAWAGAVEDLLFDGESVRNEVRLGDSRVVVTTHRLLAFTPSADGENYRQVDLPNVADVRAGHVGEENLLMQAVRMFLYGGILLGVGLFVDFGAFVPTDAFSGGTAAAGQVGIGGLLGVMQSMLELIARIDDFARMIGALLLAFGAFVVVVYLLTRDRVLEIGVAGDGEDITVPVGEDAGDGAIDEAVAALERELFASGPASGDGDPGPAGDGAPTGAAANADAGFKPDDPL